MSPSSKRIGAVVLAAGGSSRFGEPKQLIPFRGKSLVRRIIDVAGEARCAPVIVVIGSEDEKLYREFDGAGVVTVQNHQWSRGIGSSIRSGIEGLINSSPDVDASVLLVCDQPAVDARVIERLIALHETTGKTIVVFGARPKMKTKPMLAARTVPQERLARVEMDEDDEEDVAPAKTEKRFAVACWIRASHLPRPASATDHSMVPVENTCAPLAAV